MPIANCHTTADRLADITAIEQALFRYARGVDRRDWTLVRSAYHPDAIDNHGNYRGPIEGFVSSLVARHAHIEQSLHVVSNVLVEFNAPDSALVESYFTAYQRLSPSAGASRQTYLDGEIASDSDSVDNEAIGRYVDHFTRREGEWRIQRRDVLFDLYRSRIAQRSAPINPALTLSVRDQSDFLYARRQELGL
ncbi:nuclear transport factor 2 family protein [Ottowia thiooxydans]|uniref:SnoaL-like domain-containing protein n=1 Tax=Ottowia thiooxydans TaxID=219182 RepID=A0ABV2Q457_9BURK